MICISFCSGSEHTRTVCPHTPQDGSREIPSDSPEFKFLKLVASKGHSR
ncbi:hypothetical protein FOTG_17595 [Fusarium oxysporum f. sp. vasinfectum 25433]|uniref:Uncharacterized protein n=1 Tax=Fusarium oxysporum f. sp. vasinfectum 25433 TaxID=1089449 RepID=X0KKB3_FUSOX|nr:hypothetical protein FOTG_17595 [Fusarium oxysporum f. sp. vasinfectum 25433]